MIDMHAHFLPARLVDALRARDTAPNIATDPDGTTSIGIHRTRIPFNRAFDDVEARLALLDELGIERQVLSLPGLFGIDSLPGAEAGDLTGRFNDGISELVGAYPDRFAGIAALPLAHLPSAVEEYRRARDGLGLAGMILPGDAFVSVAQAQSLVPLFRAAQELGGLIFVHPGPVPAAPAPVAHTDSVVHRRATVDIQNRLTEVMVTLALSDFLDDFADVPVQVANLGGSLPFIIERMDHVYALRHRDLPPPSQSMRPLYVDTASMGTKALELAVELYGADRILFGTDDPVFDDRRGIEAVEASRLSTADKTKILSQNAKDLLSRVNL